MVSRAATRAAKPKVAGSALAVAIGLTLLVSAPSASGEQEELPLLRPSPALLGTWTAPGRGLRKVVISRSKPGWVKVAAYGACQPTLCNWGPVRARLYADDAFAARIGTGFIASYDFNAILTNLTAHLVGGSPQRLRVETYERFVDGSGRFDYWSSLDMRRG